MKVTNLSKQTSTTTWKAGDFYLQTSGNLRQIGYTKDKGYFVISLCKADNGDYSTNYYWKTLDDFIKDHGKEYGMKKVEIKEIIVEEI